MSTTPETIDEPAATTSPGRSGVRVGLSGKLLLLTIAFVLVAEVLIYVPLIANFRLNWLNDRLAAAHTAAMVLDAAPSGMVPESLAKKILDSIGARAVAVKMGDQRRLLASADLPSSVEDDVDMRHLMWWQSIKEAFDVLLFCKPTDVMRVIGPAPMAKGQFIEIILDEGPLRSAMLSFSVTIMLVSLGISAFTAMLVFFALHYLLVRPMGRLTANMVAFRADPENSARIIERSGRRDEIGTAEEELASMQRELASMLHQKNRLASLGLAVAKINHDLRSLLASAQLFSDQISSLPDPKVQRFAPKLMHAIERAVALCQSTLSYGRAQEAPPDRKTVVVESLIEEVRESLGLTMEVPIRWIVSVERGLTMEADPDQMFRVMVNLGRNAIQALANHDKDAALPAGKEHEAAKFLLQAVANSLPQNAPIPEGTPTQFYYYQGQEWRNLQVTWRREGGGKDARNRKGPEGPLQVKVETQSKHMGRVNVGVSWEPKGARLDFKNQHQDVRELLSQSLPELEKSLALLDFKVTAWTYELLPNEMPSLPDPGWTRPASLSDGAHLDLKG